MLSTGEAYATSPSPGLNIAELFFRVTFFNFIDSVDFDFIHFIRIVTGFRLCFALLLFDRVEVYNNRAPVQLRDFIRGTEFLQFLGDFGNQLKTNILMLHLASAK